MNSHSSMNLKPKTISKLIFSKWFLPAHFKIIIKKRLKNVGKYFFLDKLLTSGMSIYIRRLLSLSKFVGELQGFTFQPNIFALLHNL